MEKATDILKGLNPRNEEELSLLQNILQWALRAQQGLAIRGNMASQFLSGASLTNEINRYFHSLVEALEIYQSIHGQAIPVSTLTVEDKILYEIKQIRDLCLQEGLHSIY